LCKFAKCKFARYLDCKLATPSAARLLLYLYVQRNFDYCSVHVSTVSSHSAFWFSSSSQNGLHHQHRADIRSFSCVILSWLNGVTQYCSRNLCGFAYRIFVEYYVNSSYGLRHPMKLVPFATRVCIDVKAFPSCPSVPLLITNSIVHHCGLRHPMKLAPFATRVRMDVKAFPSRPSVPLLITNSQRRNSILFMTAMKYQWITSSENFSRSRWHSNFVSYGSDIFPCHA
ncbi:hypothetical protein T06_13421, partial [Trichinella sp. T6]